MSSRNIKQSSAENTIRSPLCFIFLRSSAWKWDTRAGAWLSIIYVVSSDNCALPSMHHFSVWLTKAQPGSVQRDDNGGMNGQNERLSDIGMDCRVDKGANSQSLVNNGEVGSNLCDDRMKLTLRKYERILQTLLFYSWWGVADLWLTQYSGL